MIACIETHPFLLTHETLVAPIRNTWIAKGLSLSGARPFLLRKFSGAKRKATVIIPQLDRFKCHADPHVAIAVYLRAVFEEATRRGYAFDRKKIGAERTISQIPVIGGQVSYELGHLRRKLWIRYRSMHRELCQDKRPGVHPLFVIVRGGVQEWEKI